MGVWKGDPIIVEKDTFQKRLLVSNIPKGVSVDTVQNTIKKIFPNVEFCSLACGKISGGVRFLKRNFTRNDLDQDWAVSAETGLMETETDVAELVRNTEETVVLPAAETLVLPEPSVTVSEKRNDLVCFYCKRKFSLTVSIGKDFDDFKFFCHRHGNRVAHIPKDGELEQYAFASWEKDIKCFVCRKHCADMYEYTWKPISIGCFCNKCSVTTY